MEPFQHLNTIEIKPYSAEFENDFKRINMEWLNHYQLLEDADVELLDNLNTIVENNGCILIALHEGKLVGTLALVKHSPVEFELVKMAVAWEFQGRGISKLLLNEGLKQAMQAGAIKITLFSNSKLKTALRLYEKYGFQYISNVDSPFITADVKMELKLPIDLNANTHNWLYKKAH